MFQSVKPAPPDPILGLTEAFNADPNPDKINLGVGVYKDARGKTPVLESVRAAERRLLETEASKSYKPIDGDPAFGQAIRPMIFGPEHRIITEQRVATTHCPGGTGALRTAAEYLRHQHPTAKVWLSEPTWANHPKIFAAAGLETERYAYFDNLTNTLSFEAMIDSLGKVPAGDVVLLHGSCHNPTGADPTAEQWARIAEVLAERQIVPLVDFAYQGFGDGLEEDALGVRVLADRLDELMVCTSYSKNFSLYNERVGALSVVAGDPGTVGAVQSHVKAWIRANYSNPPAHGAAIVTTIVNDRELTAQWAEELAAMRERINRMRTLFVETLKSRGVARDFDFIADQRGMFSFSGLTEEQVKQLREQYAIYIVGSGRINVAGMTESNMDRLCEAIASVL